MDRRRLLMTAVILPFLGLAALADGRGSSADDDADEDQAQERLIKAFAATKVSLQQALITGEREGQPIAAKFDTNEGRLQLFVYTAKDERFFEVLVDHTTGRIAKVELIVRDDDLAAAKLERDALTRSKTSLKEAVDRALSQSIGFRALSVTPGLKHGHAVAFILLLKEWEFKTVKILME